MVNHGMRLCTDEACYCERSEPIMELIARLPNGEFEAAAPLGDQQHYGTSDLAPSVAFTEGLPLKGSALIFYGMPGKVETVASEAQPLY